MNDFLITIDVEDWFQVENLRPWNPPALWDSRELRVEKNVHRLLELFEDLSAGRSDGKGPGPVRATFFVLGWVVRRLPHLVRAIVARGHEVASHGNSHRMCIPLGDAELREDLLGSKRLLEDIAGVDVAGFRAPNFSVDDRVLGIVRECGYRYDSSYNSFALHGRYGKISLNGDRMGIAHRLAEDFFELPVSNLSLSCPSTFGTIGNLAHFRHVHMPWSGGAYFRLIPLGVFKRGVRSILKRDGAYLFYMHPWEVDPGQPRVRQASMGARFKHYTGLSAAEDKLKKMIERFDGCRFASCRDYLQSASDRTRTTFHQT